ncbi:MAG: DUF2905 domain-containing protein [Candidatus Limnocylindria bacterium]
MTGRARERIMERMQMIGRSFVLLGIVLVAVGFLLSAAPGIPWLGKLPGDLRFDWSGVRVFLPLTTSLLLSVVLSLLLQLLAKLR